MSYEDNRYLPKQEPNFGSNLVVPTSHCYFTLFLELRCYVHGGLSPCLVLLILTIICFINREVGNVEHPKRSSFIADLQVPCI